MRTRVVARGGSVEFKASTSDPAATTASLKRDTIMDAGLAVTPVTADRDE
ncbi:hypothetical protein [Arthrobacter rhizosphaerae]|nr:hypothetical protein [Arthrobacter rhizosphaerae]